MFCRETQNTPHSVENLEIRILRPKFSENHGLRQKRKVCQPVHSHLLQEAVVEVKWEVAANLSHLVLIPRPEQAPRSFVEPQLELVEVTRWLLEATPGHGGLWTPPGGAPPSPPPSSPLLPPPPREESKH